MLTSGSLFAQIYYDPVVKTNNTSHLTIVSVNLFDQYTEVNFKYINTLSADHYIYLCAPGHKDAFYLKANGIKYKLIGTQNISSSESTTIAYKDVPIRFTAMFKPLPLSTTSFDLIEGESGNWNLFGIKLTPSLIDTSLISPHKSLKIDIEFESGTAILTSRGEEALLFAGELIKSDTTSLYKISGFTDNDEGLKTSDERYRLSKLRAKTAASYLVNFKLIPEKCLRSEWFGENQSKSNNFSDFSKQLNRRVQIEKFHINSKNNSASVSNISMTENTNSTYNKETRSLLYNHVSIYDTKKKTWSKWMKQITLFEIDLKKYGSFVMQLDDKVDKTFTIISDVQFKETKMNEQYKSFEAKDDHDDIFKVQLFEDDKLGLKLMAGGEIIQFIYK